MDDHFNSSGQKTCIEKEGKYCLFMY